MRLRLLVIPILLACFLVAGCATVQTMFGQETTEKTALRFIQTWNQEFDRTIRLVTSHLSLSQQEILLAQIKDSSLTDKAKADLLIANTNPNLTPAQKQLINMRKKILTDSKPLITTFNAIVLSGGSITSANQAQVELLLEQLLTKYLIK